jgi:hypothetical protein
LKNSATLCCVSAAEKTCFEPAAGFTMTIESLAGKLFDALNQDQTRCMSKTSAVTAA